LGDNRIAELSLDWDVPTLMSFDLPMLDVVGFNERERMEMEVIPPNFQPVSEDEQGRLDQKAPVVCPECGHEFVPK